MTSHIHSRDMNPEDHALVEAGRFAAWCLALTVGAAALVRVLERFGPTDVSDLQQWTSWLTAEQPIIVTIGLLTILALGAIIYLAVMTTLTIALALIEAAFGMKLPVPSPLFIRRMVMGAMGALIAVGSNVPQALPATAETLSQPPTNDVPVLRHLPRAAEASDTPSTRFGTATSAPPTTSAPAPADGEPANTSTTSPPDQPRQPNDQVDRDTATSQPAPSTYIVRPGDSFWSIAETHASSMGTEGDKASIARYWLALVSENRSTLRSQDQPDLIHPGEVVRLPATETL